MSEIKELARVAMASKVLADAAKAEGETARAELAERMASDGLERVRVLGDDSADYGTVVLAAGRRVAAVTDEETFVKWVNSRYPGEVVLAVRPAFRRRLLDAATRAGIAVDTETGEVIPGVDITAGEPYLTARPSTEAKDRMRAALADNGLLSLVSGGER